MLFPLGGGLELLTPEVWAVPPYYPLKDYGVEVRGVKEGGGMGCGVEGYRHREPG